MLIMSPYTRAVIQVLQDQLGPAAVRIDKIATRIVYGLSAFGVVAATVAIILIAFAAAPRTTTVAKNDEGRQYWSKDQARLELELTP